jgi:hypothetical protein
MAIVYVCVHTARQAAPETAKRSVYELGPKNYELPLENYEFARKITNSPLIVTNSSLLVTNLGEGLRIGSLIQQGPPAVLVKTASVLTIVYDPVQSGR